MLKRVRAARLVGSSLLVAALIAVASGAAAAQDAVKIALIDVNDAGGSPFQFMIDEINAAGGVLDGKKLELVTFKRWVRCAAERRGLAAGDRAGHSRSSPSAPARISPLR